MSAPKQKHAEQSSVAGEVASLPVDIVVDGGLSQPDSLKKELDNAFQISQYNGKDIFLPASDLERIINKDSVRRYCSTFARDDLRQQTERVLHYVFGDEAGNQKPALCVFAILVLMERPALIPSVVDEGIRDRDLPLAQCERNGTNFKFARRDNPDQPIDRFESWTSPDKMTFNEHQYHVKPVIFRLLEAGQVISAPDYVDMKLTDALVLPFEPCEVKEEIKSGGFSKVVCVKIHPAHHNFNLEVSKSLLFLIPDRHYVQTLYSHTSYRRTRALL